MNPNIFDFERTAVYTRKRQDFPQAIQQNNNDFLRNMPMNNYDNRSIPDDNRFLLQNKKDGRVDLQNRYSNYAPIPSRQVYPVFQNQDNSFFYNNVPQNTRLNELNQNYKF